MKEFKEILDPKNILVDDRSISDYIILLKKLSNLYNYYNNKNVENIPEIESKGMWKQLEDIDKILDNCHWYDKKMFELYYYEQNTLDSLASKTKISRNSIYTTIDKVRTIIKDKIHEKEKEEH